MKIYCCQCVADVDARLTDGSEIYAHRPDLYSLPFWKCDSCGNFVGCHHKTKNRTAPLGCIPSKEIKDARIHIHALLDPIWQSGVIGRKQIYAQISEKVGWKYHTAKIRTIEEARTVYKVVQDISRQLNNPS
jgi:hypothetical protein